MTRRFSALLLLVCSFASPLALAGCSSPEDQTCGDKCDCEGCSDAQYNACLDEFDSEGAQADRLGCTDLYDNYVGCLADTGVCRGTKYDTSCGPEHDRLRSCIGGGTATNNPGKPK